LTNAIILGALLFVLAPQITARFNRPELLTLLRLCSVALPLGLFWPILYKYCVARFQIVAGIIYGDIVRPVIRVLSLLLLIGLGFRSVALVGTELLVGLLLIGLGIGLIARLWGKSLLAGGMTGQEKKELLAYSLPFLPLNLARGERAIVIVAGLFLAAADLGVFGVALKIAALAQVILTGLNFVFRPLVAQLYAANDLATLKTVYRAITRWIFILTLPLSFFFIVYSAEVLALFGTGFASGAVALAIISGGYLFEFGTSATQVIINMTGRSWLSLFNQLVYLLVVLVFGMAMIPALGVNGAAAAVAAGIVVVNLFRLYQSWRIVGFLPYSFYLWKPLAAMLAAGLTVYFLPLRSLAVVLPVYLSVYLAGLLCLRLTEEDRQLIPFFRPR
jgi:O-antigen/teichoic acid export membrane protein